MFLTRHEQEYLSESWSSDHHFGVHTAEEQQPRTAIGGRVFRRVSKLLSTRKCKTSRSNFEKTMQAMDEYEEDDYDSTWGVVGM
mmetsp:Transcript_124284/g.185730  ORF Transcript_124284/g.185730 Transcript_124284/m.185730 type:complete len:84 (-) Transcript_124284:13-264(-)